MKKNNILPSLSKLVVPIADLTPDPRNVRWHDERNIEAIMKSLEKFGQRKPIVVQDTGELKVIRAGNGTAEAASRLGWTKIAAVIVEEDDTTATAYAIADNRTAELAEWDFPELVGVVHELQMEMPDLGELAAIGFSPLELDDLLTGSFAPSETFDKPLEEYGKKPEPTTPAVVAGEPPPRIEVAPQPPGELRTGEVAYTFRISAEETPLLKTALDHYETETGETESISSLFAHLLKRYLIEEGVV